MTNADLNQMTTRQIAALLVRINETLSDRAIAADEAGKTGAVSLAKAANRTATAARAAQFASTIPSISL